MFTARPDDGGAAPTHIEGSVTTLEASITNIGSYLAAVPGIWGDNVHLGEEKVFTTRPDAGGDAQQHIEGSDTLLAASITKVGINLASVTVTKGDDTHIYVPSTKLAGGGT